MVSNPIEASNDQTLSSNKTSKFFLSGNYLKQTGALENTDFTRYSVRMGGEKKFNDGLIKYESRTKV